MPAARIEARLRALVPEGTGAGYSLIRDGKILSSGGVGYAAPGVPFDEDTAFRICSVTKQFTAILTMMAVADGLLQLSHHPADYWDGFGHVAPGLTLSHLLCNQSGLKDYWCLAMAQGAKAETVFSSADADRLLAAPLDTDFAPGARFAYSNTNFALMGRILERVYGMSYAELVKTKLFKPLHMAGSFVPDTTSEPLPGGTIGYEETGKHAQVNISWHGDAGIVSTLADLQRWQRALLDPDHWLQAFFQPCIAPGQYADGALAGYRCGIRRLEGEGPLRLSHFGGLRGWRMASILEPESRSAALILFNHMTDPGPPAFELLSGGDPLGKTSEKTTVSPWLFAPKEGLAAHRHGDHLSCGSQTWTLGHDAALRPEDAGCRFTVPRDNVDILFEPAPPGPHPARQGHFTSRALASEIILKDDVTFVGPLGRSQSYEVTWVRDDIAVLDCPRALDYDPPGQFTLSFDDDGLRLGCWSFQNVRFERARA